MEPTNNVSADLVVKDLRERFGTDAFRPQETKDSIPTYWVREPVRDILKYLKTDIKKPYRTLFDLSVVDERFRKHRQGLPDCDFSVTYHLLSYERNNDVRLKVALRGENPSLQTISDIWPAANWYEREAWDMFGIVFDGHPNLRRLLLPPTWKGHPLLKTHPARATDMEPFTLPDDRQEVEQNALRFEPEQWGMQRRSETSDFLFLNLGPQHPGTHGPFRIVLQMDGEEIIGLVPDIGFHHRGAEKMGERQSWHTYIPYTDRVDYLGGVMNNFAYVLTVEKLAGIDVPQRAQTTRIMLAELFRIASHLVWYGTFAQDLGAMSPVFYMFNDRERIFGIIEALCGGRMHPSFFRIGGLTQDLPKGWDRLIDDFIKYFPPHLREYDQLVMENAIFKARTKGIGAYSLEEAIEWGVTGPGLRACGMEWDFRKKRPYSGYEQLDFEIPVAKNGDCYDRAVVRVAEIRQSLRIIEQCLKNMPAGSYKADHPVATPPRRNKMLYDIETLINHFLSVSWGPVIPPGEAAVLIEATKGCNAYYLISDGNTTSYRTRIRTPSFAHLQMLPLIAKGMPIPDLMALLGSIDYVLADVDR